LPTSATLQPTYEGDIIATLVEPQDTNNDGSAAESGEEDVGNISSAPATGQSQEPPVLSMRERYCNIMAAAKEVARYGSTSSEQYVMVLNQISQIQRQLQIVPASTTEVATPRTKLAGSRTDAALPRTHWAPPRSEITVPSNTSPLAQSELPPVNSG